MCEITSADSGPGRKSGQIGLLGDGYQKDLTVTDPAGAAGAEDQINDPLARLVGDGAFDGDLGQHMDGVLGGRSPGIRRQ